MNMNDYQAATAETAVYPPHKSASYLIPGLAAEVGEFQGFIAKAARGDEKYQDLDNLQNLLVKELGDILWFVARLAKDVLKMNLEDVAMLNLEKLRDRAKRGVIKGDGDLR